VIDGEKRNYDLSNPVECRKFQLDSLLVHKLKCPPIPKEEEYFYKEFDDLSQVEINDYCKDLQAILINPHLKSQSFDIEKIVLFHNSRKASNTHSER
jgi:hypothetical protein